MVNMVFLLLWLTYFMDYICRAPIVCHIECRILQWLARYSKVSGAMFLADNSRCYGWNATTLCGRCIFCGGLYLSAAGQSLCVELHNSGCRIQGYLCRPRTNTSHCCSMMPYEDNDSIRYRMIITHTRKLTHLKLSESGDKNPNGVREIHLIE